MSTTARANFKTDKNCPCLGDTLGRLVHPMILTILAREELHGYKIVERMADMPPATGRRPDATGVYRFLRAMEGGGLVVSAWSVSKTGPAKRLYRLTKAGRACLRSWIKTLETYRSELGEFLTYARRGIAQQGRRQATAPCGCRGKADRLQKAAAAKET